MTTQTLAGKDPNDTKARYAIIRAGLTVLADDHVMAALEGLPYASIKRLCSVPNPDRVGLLDVYQARLKPHAVEEEMYHALCDAQAGFCMDCDAFTTADVEPDAAFYPCDTCAEEAVMGTEAALVMGIIAVVDEEGMD
jgi:hypothetical protein